ncbi:unnamed protein product [Mytilus edulis]|uniref:RNA-directed DNA polymerase n=1 Tax=Mytilus edulis TaxID=6550 RepID=A0A8S3R1H2_MYTED|nr:unnamed protein product [Mytilus edulis]
MDRNRINIQILDVKTNGLVDHVDTGAAVSCISYDLVKKFENKVRLDRADIPNIYGVGGEKHKVKGKVMLPLNFKGLIIDYSFLVIEDLQHPLILGDDFLLANKANIHYPTRTLYLHEGTVQVALINTQVGNARMAKTITIPGSNMCELPVIIPKKYLNKPVILEPVSYLEKSQLMGACCLVQATRSNSAYVKMQIINPNRDPVTIPRNQVVAMVSHVDIKTLQNLSDVEKQNINTNSVSNLETKQREKSKKKSKLDFDLSSAELTDIEKQKLKKFLDNNRNVFATDLSELGQTNIYQHEIQTTHEIPVRTPPYRTTPVMKEEIQKQVDKLLENNIIKPSTSPYNSSVVLVKKKDNTFRFTIDFRKVNAISKAMFYPLPNLNDVFDTIGAVKPKIWSSLDMAQGYWQIELHPNSRHKSAFVTHNGVYEWNRMPNGLKNSSFTFQMVMSQILQGLNWKNVLVYVDDILIFSENFEEHLTHLNQVFDRLRKANLTLKPSKCHFGVSKVKYLGHILSKNGIQVDEAKIKLVKEHPIPKTQQHVRQFLGLYKPFLWTAECQKSFETLQNALTTAPILAFPDLSKSFTLTCDASGSAIGYILGQVDENKRERVISYGGRALKNEEKNWTISEKECLAVLEGIKQHKVYLLNNKFTVFTDHKALIWLHKSKDTNSKLGRWALQLQDFDFEIIYKEGKNNQNADAISRIPYPPQSPELKDTNEQDNNDLGENPYPIINSMSQKCSQNENQKISDGFIEMRFEYGHDDPIVASIVENKLDNLSDVAKLQRECPELTDIITFLENGTLPKDEKKAKTVYFDKDNYRLGQDGELIHQWWPRTKGVPRIEAMIEQLVLPKILREDALLSYHDCKAGGGHAGIKKTYAALHLKYYWPGMYQQVYSYVISCDKCQRAKRPAHKQPAPLMPLPVTDTFDRWHMDILTTLPTTKENYKHILLIVDSFSKWSEAFPLKTQEATEIAHILYNQVFTRFGCPASLTSDRGQNFCSKLIQALCELFQVTRHHTSSYHPQSNSTCERMNSTIGQILRTYCDQNQMNWADLIPSVMMAIRMSPNTESTGFSPYHMVFGKEMNIPFDISVLPKDNMSKSAKEHLHQLIDHLKIVKKVCKQNLEKSQEKSKQYYDKRSKEPNFRVGDRVLLQCMKVPKGLSPKLHAKWIGPYYITNVGQNNTYKLRRMSDHKIVKSRIHANRIKPYEDPRNVREPVRQNNDDLNDNSSQNDDSIDIDKNDDETQLPNNVDDPNLGQDNQNDIDDNDQTQSETDNDSEFLAEKLVAKKKRNGKNYYRVKWVGYKKTTWVAEEDIGEGLLVEFYTKYTKSGKLRKKETKQLFYKSKYGINKNRMYKKKKANENKLYMA